MNEKKYVENNNQFNYQMCILKAIAICFVVFGHVRADRLAIGTLYGLFPYYSFHIPLFLFVTGYFYKKVENFNVLPLVYKKVKNYVVYFYCVNGLFLIVQTLLRYRGFSIGDTFSLLTWLILPWITLEPKTFAAPTWYLIAAFIAEIIYIFLRNLVALIIKNEKAKEICIGLLCTALGVSALYLCHYASLSNPLKVIIRSCIMIPFLDTGFLYRYYLEKIDNTPSIIYFSIVLMLQYLLLLVTKNNNLHFLLHDLSGFENVGVEYYFAGISGIALWLRVSRLLSKLPESKLIINIGMNTKYIMANHLFGFFLLNCFFALLKSNGFIPSFFERFSIGEFKRTIYFTYKVEPRIIPIYFAFGIAFSLVIVYTMKLARKMLKH